MTRLRTLILCLAVLCLSTAQAAIFTGSVIGPDGKPVSGAKVAACTSCAGLSKPVMAQTGASGAFKISLTDCKPSAGSSHWAYAFVYSPGYVLASAPLEKGANTLKLEYAGQIWGTVVDEKGKPVTGVTISLIDVDIDSNKRINYSCSPFHDTFTVKSMADGRWSIPGVPISGKATVVLQDKRFAQTWTQVQLGADTRVAPPIVARAGAEMVGRVICEGGKPAKGVLVSGQGRASGSSYAVTGSDGTYHLYSLSTGLTDILPRDRSGKFIAPGLLGVAATEGKVTRLRDITMIAGSLIQGTIVEKGTGRPRPGMPVFINGPQGDWFHNGGARGSSDAKGRYGIRVAPGKNTIQIFNPDGFGRAEKPIVVTIGKGEKRTIDIKLEREVIVAGHVVGPDGKPVPNVPVNIVVVVDDRNNSTAGRTKSDNSGRFRLPNMVAGKARFSIGSDYEASDWAVVAPKEVVLPCAAPITIKVSKAVLREFAGKVLTPDGKPVPGAVLHIDIDTPIGESGCGRHRETDLTTNTEGVFRLDKLKPDETEITVATSKQGYVFVSGGKVKLQKEEFQVTDIIMSPLTGRVAGRVLDPTGAPVAGAKVAATNADLGIPIETDAQGGFTLTSLPEGDVDVYAARGFDVGNVKVHTGDSPVEIKLVTPRRASASDIESGYAILEQAWKTSEGARFEPRESIPLEIAASDPDLAMKMIEGSKQPTVDIVLAGTIATLARFQPDRAVEWGVPKLDQIQDPHMRIYALTRLGLAVVGTKPDLAARLYQQAKSLVGSPGEPLALVVEYGTMTALAARLKNGEAESMLDKFLSLEQMKKDSGWRGLLAEFVACGSPELVLKILSSAPKFELGTQVSGCAARVARYDLPAAKKMLAEMQARLEPEDAPYMAVYATREVVEALGPGDPRGVLEYVRKVSDARSKPVALTVAASYQSKDVALKVLQEAANAAMENFEGPDQISAIAGQAYDLDPKAGLDLFAIARRGIGQSRYANASLAILAFYYEKVDPAESRLMLEAYLAKLKRTLPKNVMTERQRVVVAMAPLDLDRALALTQIFPKGQTMMYDTQCKIAQYVLAGDDARRSVDFYQWSGGGRCWPEMPGAAGLSTWKQ